MFDHVLKTSNSKLEEAIEKLLTQMLDETCETEQYAKMADQLVKLYKAKELDSKINVTEFDTKINVNDSNRKAAQETEELLLKKDDHRMRQDELEMKLTLMDVENQTKTSELKDRRRVSPDTLALVGANLAGIVMIIGYERMNVIASKALGFVSKLR